MWDCEQRAMLSLDKVRLGGLQPPLQNSPGGVGRNMYTAVMKRRWRTCAVVLISQGTLLYWH